MPVWHMPSAILPCMSHTLRFSVFPFSVECARILALWSLVFGLFFLASFCWIWRRCLVIAILSRLAGEDITLLGNITLFGFLTFRSFVLFVSSKYCRHSNPFTN